jgi:beta-phosphoglucomutase-like phosphatase (HAD superfamily)
MVKLVIFDLDGVLVDTKNLHFDALNMSLENEYKIRLDRQMGFGWIALKSTLPFKDEYIKINGNPTKTLKLSELIESTGYNSTLPKAGRKWWQKLFRK